MTTEIVEQPAQTKTLEGAVDAFHENSKLLKEAGAATRGDSATESDGDESAPELEETDPAAQQAQKQVTMTSDHHPFN